MVGRKDNEKVTMMDGGDRDRKDEKGRVMKREGREREEPYGKRFICVNGELKGEEDMAKCALLFYQTLQQQSNARREVEMLRGKAG